MKKGFLAALLILVWAPVFAQPIERPKLVVGVVIDQMREEYLYRFSDHYGKDGFKRLMNEGFELKNAHFNYIPTYTGPGHASLYTGTTPRVHGVIANHWYDRQLDDMIYCATDSNYSAVGGSVANGYISPRNLQTSTITDELSLFFAGNSKIVGLSIKDRGAVFPAGHNPSGAYWYDSSTGDFMTSSYYIDEVPKWLKDFNQKNLTSKYMKGTWETFFPIEKYIESHADDRSNEDLITSKSTATFPYNLEGDEPGSLIKVTPWGNTILLDAAIAAIEGEELGKDEITDFLTVSFSSTDYVGHAFGPYSKEIQDTYIRLDRELARLFTALDEQAGQGQWTVFLSADHAVAPVPGEMKKKNIPGDYFKSKSLKDSLNEISKEKFGHEFVLNLSNNQLFMNKALISKRNASFSEVKAFFIDYLAEIKGIKAVYDADEICLYSGTNYDVAMLAAGYNQSISGDLLFTSESGWLGSDRKGTSHGTHYAYDTHVPMLFYGWGVKPGKSYQYHPVTDIAPTISMMLNISLPSGCTGNPIYEILE